MLGKRSAPKWAVIGALVLLLATTALAAAQSPDLLLPLVTGAGQAERVAPEEEPKMPPLEPDPNMPVGDSRDTHSGDSYLAPAEPAAIDAFDATQWTVQNKLGIGTQTPTADIDLSRNVNNYTRLLVRNPHSGGDAQSQLYLNTGNPGVVLQQFGSGYSATWNGLSLANRARLRTTPTVAGMILTTGGVAPLILGTNDQERMRILSDGRVGIGTTTPLHKLSIVGGPAWTTSYWSGAIDLPNGSAIGWRANAGGKRFGMGHTDNAFYIFRTASDPGTTGTSATYDMIIDDSGRVGIGTTSPNLNAKLHVKGGTWIESVNNGVNVYQPGNDGVHVYQPVNTGVFVDQPGYGGMYVSQPGYYGLEVQCPCGSSVYPNTGVLVRSGNIRIDGSGSFIVNNTTLNVPDYVFEPEYPLLSLDELRTYVTEEKHLPNVPNEEEIRAGGLDLSDFQMKLLEKTEELTLYTLAQDEQIQSQQQEIEMLRQENRAMRQTNQAQDEELETLRQENEAKDEQLAAMQQMMADLEARLAALEAQE